MNAAPVVDLGGAGFLLAVDEPDGERILAAGLEALGLPPDTAAVGFPSSWGGPRRKRLEAALRAVGAPVPAVPRARLIAASHADAATSVCAVVEQLQVPGEPPCDAPSLWSVQLLRRSGTVWRIERCWAGEEYESGHQDVIAAGEIAFIEGSWPWAAPAVPVLPVDTGLIRRHGARGLSDERVSFGFPAPPPPRRGRAPRVALLLSVLALLAIAGAGLTARWPRPAAPADSASTLLGPVTMEIPADWRRTELSGDRPDDGRGLRAVFADDADGRRLIVVVTGLRAGATAETVAESLRNRIAQRGDEVVVEFSAGARYGGREVIAYREAPASGAAIGWYVVVDGGTQISIGCQPGTGPAPIDPPCAAAVASAATIR